MGATATRAGSHVCGVRGCPRKCCWRVNREAPKYVAPLGVAFFVSSCLAVRMLRSFSWGRAGRGVQLVPPPHLPPRQLHAAPDRCTPQPPQSPQQALRTLRSSLCAPRHPPRPPGRQQTPTQRIFPLPAIPEPFLRIHARTDHAHVKRHCEGTRTDDLRRHDNCHDGHAAPHGGCCLPGSVRRC